MISFWDELWGMEKWQDQALCTPLTMGTGTLPPKSHRNVMPSSVPTTLPCLCRGSGRLRHMFLHAISSFSYLLLISTNTMNSHLFLTAKVILLHGFWTRTTSPRSLPPCLDATCLSLQGDTEPCSPPLTLRRVMSFQSPSLIRCWPQALPGTLSASFIPAGRSERDRLHHKSVVSALGSDPAIQLPVLTTSETRETLLGSQPLKTRNASGWRAEYPPLTLSLAKLLWTVTHILL